MCGVAGLILKDKVEFQTLNDMVQSIRYRGPDDVGFFIEGNVGLGHCRLSILDPRNGIQPVKNEYDSIVLIFNGEIYNYISLREDVLKKGHMVNNNSDTAILPHLYEEYGLEMFKRLNGQFAIAIWDKQTGELILARDRLGEKPLYYYHRKETFCFASEAKAIFKSGLVNPDISATALKQAFTYWTTLSNRSIFEDIYQLPQGSYLVFRKDEKVIKSYWDLSYGRRTDDKQRNIEDFTDELDERLQASIKARMVADVPISFYLSGGLDSSLITGIAAKISKQSLNTFSITFDDSNYDESQYQEHMSVYLGTNHRKVLFSAKEIPSIIKNVIFQTEVPLFRSGPFPMYVLAKLVRDNDKKVVLSGEGSDELFGGYDIFREVKIREFCSRCPDSKNRASLYKRVNNFVSGLNNQPTNSLSIFYNKSDINSWYSSHSSRWKLGVYSQQFFSQEYRARMVGYDEIGQMESLLPKDFRNWSAIQRAQYLEIVIFFSNYLLSSQGDRVSMASGVECRYPFLDYQIVEFANSLPDTMKIKALNEKYIIKKLAQKYLPELIAKRTKFPYRAPINVHELLKDEYINYMVSCEALKKYGIFNPQATEKLLSSILLKQISNERESMLFMGILTTQILCDQIINRQNHITKEKMNLYQIG